MGLCVFKTTEIKRIVKHALQSKSWRQGYDDSQPACPALMFVHDSGVYCMSSGLPSDKVGESNFCAYAKGTDPRTDEDYYEVSRDLVGGDDFVEVLPCDADTLRLCDEFSEMIIKVTEAELTLAFRKPKTLKKAV